MFQPPLLPAIRVRGPFQRDRESQSLYEVEAAKEKMRLVQLFAPGTGGVNVHRIRTSSREMERSTGNDHRSSQQDTRAIEVVRAIPGNVVGLAITR